MDFDDLYYMVVIEDLYYEISGQANYVDIIIFR